MKFTMFSKIFAALAFSGSVLAQDGADQFGPFFLQIQSNNTSVNGRYISACHAGAAIQALCINKGTNKPVSNIESFVYYFNYTGSSGQPDELGTLTWNMPISGGGGTIARNISLPLSLNPIVVSNVAAAMFSVGTSQYLQVGWHNDVMYLPSWVDDSTFVAGVRPNVTGSEELRRWYSCYQMVGTYYYESLAWVYGGAPHNPTCTPVDVVKVSV